MTGLTKGVLSFGTAGILTAVFYLFDTGVIQPQRDEIRQMPAASPITTTQTRASNPGLSYPGLMCLVSAVLPKTTRLSTAVFPNPNCLVTNTSLLTTNLKMPPYKA